MTYNKFEQKEDKRNRRQEMGRLRQERDIVRRQTTAKIKDFNWKEKSLGIRPVDADIFKFTARAFDHIIMVRATNDNSLRYIGNKNMHPKPIDCKAKTADYDVWIPSVSRYSKTAGLVVDPTIAGAGAFKDSKYNKVIDAWNAFLKNKSPDEIKAKAFHRRESLGCYAVDLNTQSDYYGCLMISTLTDFTPLILAGKTMANETGMQYIHGDYDLYALINIDNPNESTHIEYLNGEKNVCTDSFPTIRKFINDGIGSDMIQHGDQYHIEHQNDKLYVFYPTGAAYTIDETGQSIQEIFELVYGVKSDKSI